MPVRGTLVDVYAAAIIYIVAALSLGVLLSTLAKTQFQSMQLAFFTFLPQILLSGFMFPFRGMPGWAQAIGEVLPLTHFLRIVRGIMLKGSHWHDVRLEAAAIAAFVLVMVVIAMGRYRQTID